MSDKYERDPEIVDVRVPSSPKPIRRAFPGPTDVQVALRVAFERGAYAEFVAHAKESLDEEVCGILGGHVCEDEEGEYVHVVAAIRAPDTRQGRGHVTFTHESWDALHAQLDKDYPDLRIVGWYHTHPGFGVEFSDMDLFIQQNFFPAPTQVALVTDPLSGDEAMIVNSEDGPKCIERFWIDGREKVCRGGVQHESASNAGSQPSQVLNKRLEELERRLGQTLLAVDRYHESTYRLILAMVTMVGIAVVLGLGYTIWSRSMAQLNPPENYQFMSMPLRIDGRNVLVGLRVVQWEVPPELNAIYLQMEEQRRARQTTVKSEGDTDGAERKGDGSVNGGSGIESTESTEHGG